MTTTTAVATLETSRDRVMEMIPKVIDRERFMANAVAIAKLPAVKKCEANSVMLAIVGAARLGLDLDPALGWSYIVPRSGRATLMIGYRGFMELAYRSRVISAIHAEVVYTQDDYKVSRGTKRSVEHETWQDMGMPSGGEPRAAYVTWLDMRSNTVEFHTIDTARIARAKKSSAAGSGPWSTDPEAMVKKTAVRDAARFWPLSPELAAAVQWDEQAERGDPQTIRVVDAQGKETPAAMDAVEGDTDDGLDGYADAPTDEQLAGQTTFNPEELNVDG